MRPTFTRSKTIAEAKERTKSTGIKKRYIGSITCLHLLETKDLIRSGEAREIGKRELGDEEDDIAAISAMSIIFLSMGNTA